ncbi:MAG: hypothetical protein KAQ99_01210 [Candidatus Aureabacteria bacterium]|nr:hypothetical protein [Candidatus Auribacterota bacterium]
MKKFKVFCYFFYSLLVILWTINVFAEDWKEFKSEHFIVYFTGNDNFAKDVLHKAEKYYRNVAIELGYSRYSDFWSWDNRVKIYVYPDRETYLKETKQISWSHGMADYREKSISSYEKSEDFTLSVLPHEIAHLIFRDFVGFKGEIPLWLDEGVAQWAEEARRERFKTALKQLYEKDALLLLSDLMKLDVRRFTENRLYIRPTITKDGEGGVVFLSLDQLISTYYLEGVGLVGFLIEKYGSKRFAGFCRQLRDGKTMNGALKGAYPNHIKNIEDLEKRWREHLKRM